jgi:hypothetical protein
MFTRSTAAAVLAAALVSAAAAASPQDAKSPDAAKQLAQLLDQQKLDSIAAADKDNPGTYVAALYFPGAQLLVISAKYPTPQILDDKIAKKTYRDAYIELTAGADPASRLFVRDTLADGLLAKPGDSEPPDNVERAAGSVAFDGNWKKEKMTEEDYMKTFGDVDAQYAHALQVLIDKVKSGA